MSVSAALCRGRVMHSAGITTTTPCPACGSRELDVIELPEPVALRVDASEAHACGSCGLVKALVA